MAQLRDFTDGQTSVPIEVTWSPLYELLAIAWILSDKESGAGQEHVRELYDEVSARLDPDRRAKLETAGVGGGAMWLGLFGTVARLEANAGVRELVSRLRRDGTQALRTSALCMAPHAREEDVAAAAAGDAEAFERIRAHARETHPAKLPWLEAIGHLVAMPDEVLLDLVEQVLVALHEAAADHLARVGPALARDADASRALTLTMPSERVVETVTRGIEYRLRPGIETIRLIPSAVVRPWSVMLVDGGTQIFVYPVGEQYLAQDPDMPPGWLVGTYKALADERRLRILRRVANRPATFGELVDHLGLAKSTVHHHIGILRAAGLIRVALGDPKEQTTYSLRPEVLPEAERLLAGYLTDTAEGDQ